MSALFPSFLSRELVSWGVPGIGCCHFGYSHESRSLVLCLVLGFPGIRYFDNSVTVKVLVSAMKRGTVSRTFHANSLTYSNITIFHSNIILTMTYNKYLFPPLSFLILPLVLSNTVSCLVYSRTLHLFFTRPFTSSIFYRLRMFLPAFWYTDRTLLSLLLLKCSYFIIPDNED